LKYFIKQLGLFLKTAFKEFFGRPKILSPNFLKIHILDSRPYYLKNYFIETSERKPFNVTLVWIAEISMKFQRKYYLC